MFIFNFRELFGLPRFFRQNQRQHCNLLAEEIITEIFLAKFTLSGHGSLFYRTLAQQAARIRSQEHPNAFSLSGVSW